MSLTTALGRSASHSVPAAAWAVPGVIGVVLVHLYVQRLPEEWATPLTLSSHLYALLLTGSLLGLSAALGLRLLRTIGLGASLDGQTLLFAAGLGLGGVAYSVLALGLAGRLRPWIIALLLLVLAVTLRSELRELGGWLSAHRCTWRVIRRQIGQERSLRLGVLLAEVFVGVLLLKALAPPTGYDALLYHLAGAKEFLRLERIAPLQEIQQANMPFTVQLLYLLGMALGSDELSGLLHVSLALLTMLATVSFGQQLFGGRIGWIAGLIFLSAPAMVIYAPLSNIDYGLAYFDFLAVYAFAIWTRSGQARWLALAGVTAGLSLGTKYLGILTFGAIALGIALETARAVGIRPKTIVRLLALFVVPALLTASPWYLKNWLWLGSPFWPFLAADVPDVLAYFGHQMHSGRTLTDYLLLPLRLYFGGAVEYAAAIPPLAFLLAPCSLLVRRDRLTTYLLCLAALHFAVWSQGIQTLRYLFPIFPALSLVVAITLHRVVGSLRSGHPLRHAASWLPTVSMLAATGAAIVALGVQSPVGHLIGLESRADYLARSMRDYGAVRYLNTHRAEVSRALVVGDSRLYYIEPPFVTDQGFVLSPVLLPPDEPEVAIARLRRAGISHVLVGQGYLGWLNRFDPERRVLTWWDGFERTRPAYLITEFENDVAAVYRVADDVIERSQP